MALRQAIRLTVAVALCVAAAPATRPVGVLQPAPPEADIDRARAALRTELKVDYAKSALGDRRRLAQVLLARGLAWPGGDDAGRFAVLAEARDVAAGAGEVALALSAVRELARVFDIDVGAMNFATLALAGKRAELPQQWRDVADAAQRLADERALADDYDGALRASVLAEDAARKLRDPQLSAAIAIRTNELADQKRQAVAYTGAMARLAASPDDADANLQAGEFLCFVKGDWGRGLVMLSRGRGALRDAAEAELRAAGSRLGGSGESGDRWWDAGATLTGRRQRIAQARAWHQYTAGWGAIDAAARAKAGPRIATVVNALPANVPLVDLDAARRSAGDATWAAWTALDAGAFSVREDLGDLKYAQAHLQLTPPAERASAPALRYRLRLLLTNDAGKPVVLERSGKLTLPDEAGKPARLAGPKVAEIRAANRGHTTPANAHLRVSTADGVVLDERVWKFPVDGPWWLDDELVAAKSQ